MRTISDYETLDELWHDLNTETKDRSRTAIRGKFYQEQLRIANALGDIITRIIFRPGYGPTCFRLSMVQPDDPSHNQITKLDFVDRQEDEGVVKIGHLKVSDQPSGLHVVTIADIPAEQQQTLDSGLKLVGERG